MTCSLCEFNATSNPCEGCADQCRRLQVTPDELMALAEQSRHKNSDTILARAIEVGLLAVSTREEIERAKRELAYA